jgi:hypothetical protein
MIIADEIKKRAKLFAEDNLANPTAIDVLFIETAMLAGATVALEAVTEADA